MSESDYRIWSNADLDYEEWKDWMEEEYPTLSDDERLAIDEKDTFGVHGCGPCHRRDAHARGARPCSPFCSPRR